MAHFILLTSNPFIYDIGIEEPRPQNIVNVSVSRIPYPYTNLSIEYCQMPVLIYVYAKLTLKYIYQFYLPL